MLGTPSCTFNLRFFVCLLISLISLNSSGFTETIGNGQFVNYSGTAILYSDLTILSGGTVAASSFYSSQSGPPFYNYSYCNINLNGGTIVANTSTNSYFNYILNITISGTGLDNKTSAFTLNFSNLYGNKTYLTATNNLTYYNYGCIDNTARAFEKTGSGFFILSGNNNFANYNHYGQLIGDIYTNQGATDIIGQTSSANGYISEHSSDYAGMAVYGGGRWNMSGTLFVGYAGSSNLNIWGNGQVQSNACYIGYNMKSTGTIGVGNSGGLLNTGYLSVGESGTGIFNVDHSGTAKTAQTIIGSNSTGIGVVTATDTAIWTNTGTVIVGSSGTGTLNIKYKANVQSLATVIGAETTGKGQVLATENCIWTNTQSIIVGNSGTGALTVDYFATVKAQQITLGANTTGNGTLSIASNGVKLLDNFNNPVLITGGNGKGNVILAQSSTYTMNNAISGNNVSLTHAGTGTTTLTGNLSYSGTTSVNAGTLLINGDASTIHGLNIKNGATLGGTGTIGGAQTIFENGSYLTPGAGNSIGSLTINGFTQLSGNAIFDLANSTLYDRLLTDGTVNITSSTIITINFFNNFDYQEGQFYSFDLMQGVSGDHLANIQWQNLDPQWQIAANSDTFIDGTLTFNLVQIPEPRTWVFTLIGIGLLFLITQKKLRIQ